MLDLAMEVSVDQLQRAIEGQHGGKATLVSAEPVKETFIRSPLDAVRVAEKRSKRQ